MAGVQPPKCRHPPLALAGVSTEKGEGAFRSITIQLELELELEFQLELELEGRQPECRQLNDAHTMDYSRFRWP